MNFSRQIIAIENRLSRAKIPRLKLSAASGRQTVEHDPEMNRNFAAAS